METKYPPQSWARWLKLDEAPPLGPGEVTVIGRELEGMEVGELFDGVEVVDWGMARACQAGLLLGHGALEASHRISQGIHTPTGSYWHGIMHRREPDFDNARYWFARVGRHPAYPLVLEAAKGCLKGREDGAAFLTYAKEWDAEGFIDYCERVIGSGSEEEWVAREIALVEWQVLLEWTWRRAVGT